MDRSSNKRPATSSRQERNGNQVTTEEIRDELGRRAGQLSRTAGNVLHDKVGRRAGQLSKTASGALHTTAGLASTGLQKARARSPELDKLVSRANDGVLAPWADEVRTIVRHARKAGAELRSRISRAA
jgi:hypothetical protein